MNLLATTKGLSFEQLGETARRVAMDKVREWQTDDNWYDYVFEQSRELLVLLGFTDIEIFFEGFWSQGNGACFTGYWNPNFIQLEKAREEFVSDDLKPILDTFGGLLAEAKLRDIRWKLFALKRRNLSGYATSRPELTEFEYNDDVSDNYATDPRIEEWCRDLMRWIYRCLQSEYEYLSSDAHVLETIEGNDYRFDESGAII